MYEGGFVEESDAERRERLDQPSVMLLILAEVMGVYCLVGTLIAGVVWLT